MGTSRSTFEIARYEARHRAGAAGGSGCVFRGLGGERSWICNDQRRKGVRSGRLPYLVFVMEEVVLRTVELNLNALDASTWPGLTAQEPETTDAFLDTVHRDGVLDCCGEKLLCL